MTESTGAALLQQVAERILLGFLRSTGHTDARRLASGPEVTTGAGVDLVYAAGGKAVRAKVKPDPYFGTDPAGVADRALTFYRPNAGHYAFESISNHLTREPGWIFSSDADDLYYYYLAIRQTEAEVTALYRGPDEVFFGELAVERDELHVISMSELRRWFEAHYESYAPRPVNAGNHAAWFRLIPQADIQSAIAGIKTVSPVFSRVTR
ncbi:MAG: hypothetical protein U1E29_13575 [Coriobacteriia bacterium]|nr:hypothetical protein [Coriobacteriia bacterium]